MLKCPDVPDYNQKGHKYQNRLIDYVMKPIFTKFLLIRFVRFKNATPLHEWSVVFFYLQPIFVT